MELHEIQKRLKAPKNQHNNFGNYNYRSCEDILEAVKPFLHDEILTITDEIVMVGERYYVKATASFKSDKSVISTVAYARESDEKKGMDSAQITGAASSYARKYALNGLFLIDDTKDADTMDNAKSQSKETRQCEAKGNTAGINFNEVAEKIKSMTTAREIVEYASKLTPTENQKKNLDRLISAKTMELDKQIGKEVDKTGEIDFENQTPFDEI
jgi:hypothetical protein